MLVCTVYMTHPIGCNGKNTAQECLAITRKVISFMTINNKQRNYAIYRRQCFDWAKTLVSLSG